MCGTAVLPGRPRTGTACPLRGMASSKLFLLTAGERTPTNSPRIIPSARRQCGARSCVFDNRCFPIRSAVHAPCIIIFCIIHLFRAKTRCNVAVPAPPRAATAIPVVFKGHAARYTLETDGCIRRGRVSLVRWRTVVSFSGRCSRDSGCGRVRRGDAWLYASMAPASGSSQPGSGCVGGCARAVSFAGCGRGSVCRGRSHRWPTTRPDMFMAVAVSICTTGATVSDVERCRRDVSMKGW